MENYCIKEEMVDNLWNEEDYLEVANCKNNNLSQKDIEYTELLCWILEQSNWNYDIAIIRKEDWEDFYNTDEEIDMKMVIVEAEDFYEEFRKISNVDLFDESCFVKMSYIDEGQNDVNLIVKENGINKRFVIGIVG